MSKQMRIFLLSLMGLSLCWSPLYGTAETLLYPGLDVFAQQIVAARIVELAAFALACAFLAISEYLPIMDSPLLGKPLFVAGTATAVYTLGMLVTVLCGLGLLGSWALFIGAALRGLTYFTISAWWLLVITRQEKGVGVAAIFLSLAMYALLGVVSFLARGVSPLLLSFITVAAPLISFLGFIAVLRNTDMSPVNVATSHTMPKETRHALLVANLTFGFLYGGIMFWFSYLTSFPSLVVFFGTAVAMALLFLLKPRATLTGVLKTVTLVACVLAVVFVLAEYYLPSSSLLLCSALLVMIIFFSFAIFTDSEMGSATADWGTLGLCMALAAVGIAISFGIFNFIGLENISSDAMLLIAVAGLGFICLVFGPSTRHNLSSWGFSALTPKESQEVVRLRRCGELAAAHDLTARELEILQLITAGSDRDDVAEILVISPNTAKTHIRNVYAKMGVHSAKELSDLVKG